MAPIAAQSTQTIRCPRCGYDQRGVVATWSDSCPMDGTCTECGLAFRWDEVIAPEKFEPPWCVEFAPTRLRIPFACVATYCRSFLPWRFWSRLKMSQPIHWRRLAIYAMPGLLLLLLAYPVVQGTVAGLVRYQYQQDLMASWNNLAWQTASMQAWITQLESQPDGPELRQYDQQKAKYRSRIASVQPVLSTKPTISPSFLGVIVEAIVHPTRMVSSGVVTWGGGTTMPYVPPSDIWEYFIQTNAHGLFGSVSMDLHAGRLKEGIGWLLCNLTLALFIPASFALLPVSRVRAKVRWSHIGRVCMYSLALPPTLVLIAVTVLTLTIWLRGTLSGQEWELAFVCRHCGWIMLVIWWSAAIRCYMKMPHAEAIALFLTTLSALLILALMAFLVPSLAAEMMSVFDPVLP